MMPWLRRVATNHAGVLLLGCIASLIVIFPQIYFRLNNPGVYQGIELLPDSPWAPRVREVQDGHPNFGAIYYQDGKDDPYLFQPLGSMAVAYLGEIFGLGINNTILLSRIVLTFAAVILLYSFVWLWSRDKLIALSSAAVLLLADSVLSFSGLSRLLHGLSPDSFLRLARPVNPAMIYILLFGFLISFWLFYTQRKWRYAVMSGMLLGLNFYNYFYSWTYLYAFGGLLCLFLLWQRGWREVLRIASVFVGALIIGIPYIINLYNATRHAGYQEVSVRFGVVFTHAPFFIGWTALIGLILFLLWYPRSNKDSYWFGLALVLAPLITMNQQLLTGKVLQEAHYHWFFHKPLVVIVVLILLFKLLNSPRLVRYRKAVALLLIVGSVAVGGFVQAASYYYDTRDGGDIAVERQKYGPVMHWLSEHTQQEEVVLANDEVSHLTVIYTPLNVFHHRASIYSLAATKERLLEVLFTFYRLRGVTSAQAREVFFAERAFISTTVYGIHYRELLGSYEAIPDKQIEEIITGYQDTFKVSTGVWLERVLRKYHVKYVVWDQVSEPSWQLEQYPFVHKVAEFGDVILYKL